MMGYLKQDEVSGNGKLGKKTKPKRPTKTPKQSPEPAGPTLEVDMSGVEIELAHIANAVRSYVVNASNGENSLALYTGRSDSPLRLELEGDAVESIAEALTRIADALAGRTDTASNRQQDGAGDPKS
jgi:hypothetical protein